ncbi:hypothetical protein CTI12_AA251880 [Artemisia annua]|uniref:Uncharacterized protein n=1 Tax=Artemisia annua TaxID=35608 RepID=A0A2U1NM17_ARTAN|nr:hypothetical protein CTI12_AA251880 [Artemisia annua]
MEDKFPMLPLGRGVLGRDLGTFVCLGGGVFDLVSCFIDPSMEDHLEPLPLFVVEEFLQCELLHSVTKKSKKRGKEPSASEDLPTPLPYVSDTSSSDLPSYALSFHSDDKEPICLAMDENAATSSRRTSLPKPPKQVLGLPSPKVWDAM